MKHVIAKYDIFNVQAEWSAFEIRKTNWEKLGFYYLYYLSKELKRLLIFVIAAFDCVDFDYVKTA